jgi:rare lipoprotein A
LVGNGSTEVEVESIAVDSAVVTPIAAVELVKSEPLPPAPVPAPVVASPAPAAVAEAAVATTTPAAGGNTYLQLGAFRSQQGAESFLARMRADLGYVGKEVSLFPKDGLMRVHLGPFANADEAKVMAEKLEAKLGFKPVVSLH